VPARTDPRGLRCQDCEEPVPVPQRRTRCKSCGKLVCAWCLHHVHNGQHAKPARPVVKVEGLSYSMSVQVNDRPRRTFSGTTVEELDRDLRAATAELGEEA
jgi:hypothetical protein